MIQPANLNLFELLNYVVERQPSALGILVLNERARRVKFHKVMVPAKLAAEPISGKEKAMRGGQGALALQPERRALVTFELPERVGVNLKGPEPDQALLVAFSIDRAVYDEYVRRARLAESGIVLPPGATI